MEKVLKQTTLVFAVVCIILGLTGFSMKALAATNSTDELDKLVVRTSLDGDCKVTYDEETRTFTAEIDDRVERIEVDSIMKDSESDRYVVVDPSDKWQDSYAGMEASGRVEVAYYDMVDLWDEVKTGEQYTLKTVPSRLSLSDLTVVATDGKAKEEAALTPAFAMYSKGEEGRKFAANVDKAMSHVIIKATGGDSYSYSIDGKTAKNGEEVTVDLGNEVTKTINIDISKKGIEATGHYEVAVTREGYQPKADEKSEVKQEVKPGVNPAPNAKAIAASKKMIVKKFKVKMKKKKAILSWRKTNGANGYQVQYRVKGEKKFSQLKLTNKTKVKSGKLKKGKKYQFRVRTYKNIAGQKVFGKWTAMKTIKCK